MKFQNYFFILTLSSCCAFGSLFIILESSSFYKQYYSQPSLQIIHPGFFAAVLCELFTLVLSAAWVEDLSSKKRFHWMNLVIKTTLCGLFILSVAASSLNLVQEKVHQIQKNRNNSQIISLLKEQSSSSRKSFEVFAEQNQRVNTALSFRAQNEIRNELQSALKNQKSESSLWFEVILLVLLRFTIQLAKYTLCLACILALSKDESRLNQKTSSKTSKKRDTR